MEYKTPSNTEYKDVPVECLGVSPEETANNLLKVLDSMQVGDILTLKEDNRTWYMPIKQVVDISNTLHMQIINKEK